MHPVFKRKLRPIALVILIFFTWFCIEPWNYTVWAQSNSNQPSAVSDQQSTSRRFEDALKATKQAIEDLDQKITAGKDIAKTLDSLRGYKKRLEAQDQEIRSEFNKTQAFLKEKGLSSAILDRHTKAVTDYDLNYKRLKDNIDSIIRIDKERSDAEKKKDKKTSKAKLDQLKKRIKDAHAHLKEKVKEPPHTPLDPNNLPHRTPKIKPRKPRLKKEEFAELNNPIQLAFSGDPSTLLLVQNTQDLPKPEDLAETIEVQFTQEIKDLAASLNHNPVKIYNWVRNNIDFVPTYGSIQGANMCLMTKQCNDMDTASLLIALLRTSGISARYVIGTIEVPIDKVMNWVGGFTDAKAALDFISSGGTPVTSIISGGKISAAQIEHVWVEAYIDYIPSRGAVHKQGDTWIPMDGSYKQYTYTQGIDLQTAVPFDANAFLSQVQSTAITDPTAPSATGIDSAYVQTTVTDYQNQIQNYLTQNNPNATVGDVVGIKDIRKQEFSILPATLPYKTNITGTKYSNLPDSLRHKLTFELTTDAFFGPDLSYTVSLSGLAIKRITLNYGAATTNDEAVIQAYAGSTTMPAYLINLRPKLQVDGIVVAEGTSVKMGHDQTVTIAFSGPNLGGELIENKVTAGSYNALILDLQRIRKTMLEERRAKLQDTQTQIAAGNFLDVAKDDIFGNILALIGQTYFGELDTLNDITAVEHNVAITRLPSEMFTSFLLKVNFLFDIPVSAQDGGMGVDVDRNSHVVFPKDGNKDRRVSYLRSSGGISSALEHAIWEQLLPHQGLEGISAVKLLKLANDQGIPIFQVDNSNLSLILPKLELSQDVKSDIVNAANMGKTITIPKRNITLNGWNGVGYVVFDQTTGEGAYLISGGLSGGFWPLTEAFFSSLADWVSLRSDAGYVPMSDVIKLGSEMSSFLSFLGFTITVVDIVSSPNLSEAQKVAEILTWLGAIILMAQVGAAIATAFVPLAGLIAVIELYIAVTLLALIITAVIEGQFHLAGSHRRRRWKYA